MEPLPLFCFFNFLMEELDAKFADAGFLNARQGTVVEFASEMSVNVVQLDDCELLVVGPREIGVL